MSDIDEQYYINELRNNWKFIKKLNNEQRTPKVCLTAVKEDSDAIKYLTDEQRTPEVCLAAVKRDGDAIAHLTDDQKTPNICLAAVQNYGYAIQYLTDDQKTPDICLAAVKQNINSMKYINNIGILVQIYRQLKNYDDIVKYANKTMREQFLQLSQLQLYGYMVKNANY